MRKYRDLPLKCKDKLAHITYAKQSDDSTVMRGYAINANDKSRIDGCSIVKRTAKTDALIPAIELQIVNALTKKLTAANTAPTDKRNKAPTDNGMIDTVSAIIDAIKARTEPTVNQPHWAKSTQARALEHYKRHFFPMLAQHSYGEISTATIDDYRANLEQSIMNHGRSRGNTTAAANTASSALYQDLVVHDWLLDNHPELGLPIIDYHNFVRTKKIQTEQAKSIPTAVRLKFIATLESLVNDQPCEDNMK